MAYEHTIVAPEKSQNQIKAMMVKHGASNIAFASSLEPRMEGLRSTVHIEGRPYAVKIAVPVRAMHNEALQDQEIRRVWRVLYHHLKAIFEAADSGVIDIRELLLPYFVTASGKTLGEMVRADMPKALEAPRSLFLP